MQRHRRPAAASATTLTATKFALTTATDRYRDAGRFTSHLAGIDRARRSPNHGPRQGVEAPDSLVLHYTGMADGATAIAWLCEPASQVSCHYVVEESGRILQLVAEDRRAWHAGRSRWSGTADMNSASVGIEIVNGGHDYGLPPFPDAQIVAVIRLCQDIMTRHAMPPAHVLAHSDIAPGRKRDPGERFPWARLAANGVGLWPAVPDRGQAFHPDVSPGHHGTAVRQLQERLAAIGYGLETDGVFGPETETVVRAFQRRYRPDRVDGVADGPTLARLDALLALT